MPFVFEADGIERLEHAAEEFPNVVTDWLQRAVSAGVAEIVKRTERSEGIVPYVTGLLAAGIGRPPNGLEVGLLQARISPQTTYAYGVHEGTKPHDIYPKDKKALAWPGGAHPVHVVHHPGNKGNPFMTALLDASSGDITKHFEEAVAGALKASGY